MDTSPTKSPSTIRQRVVLFLALLSSRECQEACNRYVTVDEFAFDLCRLWFDEVYVPGEQYIAGIKGNRSETAAESFWRAFTPDERAALERFHRFFELRLEMLPGEVTSRETFPQDDLWINITRDARHVLGALDVELDHLEQELSWIIQAAMIDHLADG